MVTFCRARDAPRHVRFNPDGQQHGFSPFADIDIPCCVTPPPSIPRSLIRVFHEDAFDTAGPSPAMTTARHCPRRAQVTAIWVGNTPSASRQRSAVKRHAPVTAQLRECREHGEVFSLVLCLTTNGFIPGRPRAHPTNGRHLLLLPRSAEKKKKVCKRCSVSTPFTEDYEWHGSPRYCVAIAFAARVYARCVRRYHRSARPFTSCAIRHVRGDARYAVRQNAPSPTTERVAR